jgi:hypothetical protein
MERLRTAFKGQTDRRLASATAEDVDERDDPARERTIHAGDDDLRIRIRGDDIIIQRRPRGSHDDG